MSLEVARTDAGRAEVDMEAEGIVFLPTSLVAHDPAVFGPFDGAARAHGKESPENGDFPMLVDNAMHSGVRAQRTSATAAAVEAIAQGHVCPPGGSDSMNTGPRAQELLPNEELSFGLGSHVSSRSELQHMLDGIPPPDYDDDDEGSATSSSPRADDGREENGRMDCISRAWANHAQQAWGDADMGKPLADGSHYPSEQQRTIELQALMRAKDRDLKQYAKQIEEFKMQLENLERDRDVHRGRSADWEAKARDWECENTALRKELGQAKTTNSYLEEQARLLQADLSKATGSVNELQIRVDELLQGKALINASQYEHHLHQLRSEVREARSDSEAWQLRVVELQALVDDAAVCPPQRNNVCESETQTENSCGSRILDVALQSDVMGAQDPVAPRRHSSSGVANMVAQHLMTDSMKDPISRDSDADATSMDALRSQVRALELEADVLRRAAAGKAGLGAVANGSTDSASAAGKGDVATSASLVEQVQQEFVELSNLNTHLISANRALAKSNEKLMLECGEHKRRLATSNVPAASSDVTPGAAPAASSGAACCEKTKIDSEGHGMSRGGGGGGGGGGSRAGSFACAADRNLTAAEERRLGRVRLEEETNRLRADHERKLAAALEECERKHKDKVVAREAMLMDDKKAEIARLRAAWSAHTQESIRAVEDRCSRESAEALAALKAEVQSLHDAASRARVKACLVDVAVQAQGDVGSEQGGCARKDVAVCAVGVQTEEVVCAPEGSATDGCSQMEALNRTCEESALPRPHNLFAAAALPTCLSVETDPSLHETSFCVPVSAQTPPAAAGTPLGDGQEAVNIVLSLNMNLSDVKDWSRFQKEVQADVVWAAGIDTSNIVVQNLRHGSVLVDMAISAHVRHVIADLQQQCKDADSMLRRGRHTRFATQISVTDSQTVAACPAASPPPQMLSGISANEVAGPATGAGQAHEGDLREIRRLALIEKMRQLQQCREDCRAEAAAAVLELRRKCMAELEVELAEETRRVRQEGEIKRAQALALVEQQQQEIQDDSERQLVRRREEVEKQLQALQEQREALVADTACEERKVRQHEEAMARMEEECEAALAARRADHEVSLNELNDEWSKRLDDAVAACEAELEAVREACHAEKRRCEEEKAACLVELAALLERHEEQTRRCEHEFELVCEQMSGQWQKQRRELQERWHEELAAEKAGAERALEEVREQCQVSLQEMEQEHDTKVSKARADHAEQVSNMEKECRARLDEFLQQVEKEESALQARQAVMMTAAEKEVEARLDEVAQECKRKEADLERKCGDRLKQLTADVEKEEARLQESQQSLQLARRKADEHCQRLRACAVEELQGQLAEELESELAGLRLHHDRLLAQRREHEEEDFSRACAEMKNQFSERLESERHRAEEDLLQEKARIREEVAKEASNIREELTVKDTLAIADLQKTLALDRRRASVLAIDDAVKAAESVRAQTEAILEDELRREIESMQATHAIRRKDKLAALRGAHDAELLQLKADLEDERTRKGEQLRVDVHRAAAAERSCFEAEAHAETTRAVAELKAASEKRLERERLRIEEAEERSRELLTSRQEQVLKDRDARLELLEGQWAAAEERAVSELRQRLSEESRRKSATVALDLRHLASIPTDVLRTDFSRWLASSAQEVAGMVASARIDEIARWERKGDQAEASAVGALEAEIASENEESVRRLVNDCLLQRVDAVSHIQAEVKEEMQKQRAKLDAEQAARLSAALEEVRVKLAAQAREDEGRTVEAENAKTEEQVRAARESGEEELRAAFMEASRGFEQSLQAELVQLHTAGKAAQDAALAERREELERARNAQIAKVRDEVAAKTSEQLRELREQMADERERRIQAMQRSCKAELERRTLEVEVKAEAELEHALAQCRAEADADYESALVGIQAASQADVEGAVGKLREKERAKVDLAVLEAKARYDAERQAAVDALQEQLSTALEAKLEDTRRALDEAREKQVRELKEKCEAERAVALEVLKKDKTAECEAALEAVREESESARQRELRALDEQMARRKEKAISSVEAECRERLVQETEQMNEAFAASRDERVRALRSEMQGDLQAQIENRQLRAELELSRQLSALRSECLADLERCRALVQGRNNQAAQKLISVLRLKHRKESEVRFAAGERNARKQNDETVQELRDEWSALKGLVHDLLAAAPKDATSCLNSREVQLDDVMGMRIQLETAIRQVDELQRLVLLIASEGASSKAGAAVVSSARANSQALDSEHVGGTPGSAVPAVIGQRRGQVRRALKFPAAKPDDPLPRGMSAPGPQIVRQSDVSDSACGTEEQGECDLSLRSTLPSDTPCKSTTSSVASSTPAGGHVPASGALFDFSDSAKVEPHRTPGKDVRSSWPSPSVYNGNSVDAEPDAGRWPAQRLADGDLSPAWHVKYGAVSPIKHPHPSPTTRKCVSASTDSLDGIGGGSATRARRSRAESDDGDSEDSLDEPSRMQERSAARVGEKKGPRQPVIDGQQLPGSPSQERDRLLFSLLRRSSTRRSLTKIFSSASLSHGSSSG